MGQQEKEKNNCKSPFFSLWYTIYYILIHVHDSSGDTRYE